MAPHTVAPPSPGRTADAMLARTGATTSQKVLVFCGIASSLLYLAMLVFVPFGWDGYSSASQTISELSAIDAPTRPLWLWLGRLYTVLVTAFGYGVWVSARGKWSLRVVGGLLVAYGVIGLGWPPMHQRAVLAAGGKTLTDTLHVVWMMATGLLMLLAMGIAAPAFGRRFRWYSLITIMILVCLGVRTGVEAPRMEANLPTPWMGVWERAAAGAMLLWIVVLAIALLRRWTSTASPLSASAERGPGGEASGRQQTGRALP
jgi:hypothetical protein